MAFWRILSVNMGSIIHYRSIILLCLWFILFPLVSQAAPKTDTVYLQNGDRITGEIKRFFGLTFYDSFNSKPIDRDAATNDYGVTASLGYSW